MQQGTYGQVRGKGEEERSLTPCLRLLPLPPIIWKGKERRVVHEPCGPRVMGAEGCTEPL